MISEKVTKIPGEKRDKNGFLMCNRRDDKATS